MLRKFFLSCLVFTAFSFITHSFYQDYKSNVEFVIGSYRLEEPLSIREAYAKDYRDKETDDLLDLPQTGQVRNEIPRLHGTPAMPGQLQWSKYLVKTNSQRI